MSKKIIGFTGIANSGKDTAVIGITKEFENIDCFSFAKPLKDACKILFNFSDEQLYDTKLKEVVDKKWNKSPREILQWLGTDILRNNINNDFFLINMRQKIEESNANYIIISDVRFDNEGELIKSLGGKIIKITRPNFKKIKYNNHITEQGISNHLIDHDILNNGTIKELHKRILDTLTLE